jgi:hypothetical protein
MKQGELRDPDHKFEFNLHEFSDFVKDMLELSKPADYSYCIKGIEYPNAKRIIG